MAQLIDPKLPAAVEWKANSFRAPDVGEVREPVQVRLADAVTGKRAPYASEVFAAV